MQKKIFMTIINACIIVGLIFIILFSGYKVFKFKETIVTSNATFHLATDGSIKYAEQLEDGKVVKYYEYFPETKIKDKDERIKMVYTVNKNGYVISSIERDSESGKNIRRYTYKEKTKYGSHKDKIETQEDII